MNKIQNFSEFKRTKEFIGRVTENQVQILSGFIKNPIRYNQILNEASFLDSFKNKVSKFLLGDYSRVGHLDKLRAVMLSNEMDYYEEQLDINDKIESLNTDLSLAKKSGDEAKISSISKKIELEENVLNELTGNFKAKKKEIMSEIARTTKGNQRLEEYYETGRSEDDYKLAQFKYDLAKKRSSDEELINRNRLKMEKAKKEAEDAEKRMKEDMEKASDEVKDGGEVKRTETRDKSDTGDISFSDEEKLVRSKSTQAIIQRKKEIAKEIADLKADLETLIEDYKEKVKSGTISRNEMDKIRIEAIEISSKLDQRISLLSVYSSLGKSPIAIESKLSSKVSLKNVTEEINKAIAGKESEKSSLSSSVAETFSKGRASSKKLSDILSKISKI